VTPNIDFVKIEKANPLIQLESENKNKNKNQQFKKIKKGLQIKLDCDFCRGVIATTPQVLKFANYERFFCCTSCKSEYKRKYGGRIQAIVEKYGNRIT
jgi:Lrp/AsnC family leucine-responsive transcriptional regulator